MRTNDKYKETSVKVLKCLDTSDFEFKVNGRDRGNRNGNRVIRMEGWINNEGILNCKCISKPEFLFNYIPTRCEGVIDHFGKVEIIPVKSEVMPFMVPLAYHTSVWQNGQFTMDVKRKDSKITIVNIITSMTGDVFERNTEFRKHFLAERAKLYQEIRKLRVD